MNRVPRMVPPSFSDVSAAFRFESGGGVALEMGIS